MFEMRDNREVISAREDDGQPKALKSSVRSLQFALDADSDP
jgi:hypothetical protein